MSCRKLAEVGFPAGPVAFASAAELIAVLRDPLALDAASAALRRTHELLVDRSLGFYAAAFRSAAAADARA